MGVIVRGDGEVDRRAAARLPSMRSRPARLETIRWSSSGSCSEREPGAAGAGCPQSQFAGARKLSRRKMGKAKAQGRGVNRDS